jgi:mannose-6-phosphate isomerase-like protein (cupin superfamily)
VPVIHAADAIVHEFNGTVFASYAAPARGSQELCAWRLEVPAESGGMAHTVGKEEVLFVLSGALRVTLSGGAGPDGPCAESSADAGPGDAVMVPAGAVVRFDNPGTEQASAWVTTSVGFEATLPDGSRIRPPWVS